MLRNGQAVEIALLIHETPQTSLLKSYPTAIKEVETRVFLRASPYSLLIARVSETCYYYGRITVH